MQIRRKLGSIASASVAVLMAGAAQAGDRPFMPLGEIIAPPPGYADLCQRGEVPCEPLAPSMLPASLTPASAVLATSSIGGASPAHVSERIAVDASPPEADPTATLVQFAMLEAHRPVIASDFATASGWSWTMTDEAAPSTALAASTPTAPVMTALPRSAQMKMVNTINREVNRDVHKATDFDLYGLLEYWSLPRVIDGKMYGDCEDYALEKRRRLIAAGVPEEALSMAVAVTARGESHAVLVVRFESGDWVLDNLTPWATPWEELNYRWVQRQVAGSSSWTTIG